MALLNIFLAPSLTRVDFLVRCTEYGLRCYVVNRNEKKVRYVEGEKGSTVAPVYVSGKKELSKVLDQLNLLWERHDLVLLLADVHLSLGGRELTSVALPTSLHLFQLLADARKHPQAGLEQTLMGVEETSIGHDVAQVSMGNSVLHKIQTLMYRVPTEHRKEVQDAVFGYLAGNPPLLGKAGQFPAIMNLLVDEHVRRLREASLYAADHGIPEAVIKFQVDGFDLGYLASTLSRRPTGKE